MKKKSETCFIIYDGWPTRTNSNSNSDYLKNFPLVIINLENLIIFCRQEFRLSSAMSWVLISLINIGFLSDDLSARSMISTQEATVVLNCLGQFL